MNHDQQVLYHFAKAANTGPSYFIGHPELRTAAPGHMHNARWITHANWVLRLYFSTENPEKNLVKLVNFLTQINVLAWFDIVEKPSFLDFPKILCCIVGNLKKFQLSKTTSMQPTLRTSY